MAGIRVLVVDDERAVREVLTYLLASLGHIADTASDGTEALEKVETTDFQLALVDLHMGGMTGDQLAEEIKRRKPTVPVVLITGARPRTVPAAIDRVLLKPFSLDQLRTTISSLTCW